MQNRKLTQDGGGRTPGCLGEILRAAIKESGMSIAEIARRAEVRQPHLSAVISNVQLLSTPMALKIAPILKLDPLVLLRQQLDHTAQRKRTRMKSDRCP